MSKSAQTQVQNTSQSSLTPAPSGLLQRKCAKCEEEEATLQRKPSNKSQATPPVLHEVLRSSSVIQPKLKIGQPNDKYEQEADRVAEQVMRMPESKMRSQINRKDKPDNLLQTKPLIQRRVTDTKSVSEAPSIVNEVLRSPGQPLDRNTRSFMESRFGHDFSQVRVHTDSKAAKSAQSINALAYTVERNIVFGRDQYMPITTSGMTLLAHELTHVVQQGSASLLQPSINKNEVSFRTTEVKVSEGFAQGMQSDVILPNHRTSAHNIQRQVTDLPCRSLILAGSVRDNIKSRAFGTKVHNAIGRDFSERSSGYGFPVRVEIAGGAFSSYRTEGCGDAAPSNIDPVIFRPLLGRSGAGIPDLAYLRETQNTNMQIIELAEIKFATGGCFTDAETQVSNYIDKANQGGETKVFGYDNKGRRSKLDTRHYLFRAMPVERFVPAPVYVDGKRVFVSWCGPGVILYKALSRKDEGEEKKKRERITLEKAVPEIIELPFNDLQQMREKLQSGLERNIGSVPVGSEYFIIAPPIFYKKFIEEPFNERRRKLFEVRGFSPKYNPVIGFRALGWTLVGLTAASYLVVYSSASVLGGGVAATSMSASAGVGADITSISAFKAAAASPVAQNLAAAAGVLLIIGTVKEAQAQNEKFSVSNFQSVLAVPFAQLEVISESEPLNVGRRVKYKGNLFYIVGRAVAQ